MAKFLLVLVFLIPGVARALPLLSPGNELSRHDLQLLNDAGVVQVPTTTWPIANADIWAAANSADISLLTRQTEDAYRRLLALSNRSLRANEPILSVALDAAVNPPFIRNFATTPRAEGELSVVLAWVGDRFALNLEATYAANPFDDDKFRPDGTYVGLALGNWILSAGWQDRWWGPGRDSSLILSTNSRPAPGISLQRAVSEPFESRWLEWVGPWTLSTFMSELDDDRSVDGAQLFGLRATMMPPNTGLEIGISRTAQWCGNLRPCDLKTFGDLLIGNDNRGINISADDEPGNQLGGFDIRWRLPNELPVAAYAQWIAEDGRGGGGAVGSWLRQFGVEFWGSIGQITHRTHFEISDTMCREGGLGFSTPKPDCGYEHARYQTGYRYRGRSIGHAIDGDGRSYSIGSTLVQSAGHTWNFSLRYMEINRSGLPNPRHTLSSTPQRTIDLLAIHRRSTRIGSIAVGLGFKDTDSPLLSSAKFESLAFVRWVSR